MRKLKAKEIIKGQKFYNWTVIERTIAPSHIKNKSNSFWICSCNCGVVKILTGGHLRNSRTKGCRACSMISRRKREGDCSFNGLYLRYKHGALSRNLKFKLSKRQFKKLTKQNCFYCGIEPLNVHKAKTAFGAYVYNGVDRIDSTLGYEIKNCIPSCSICNRAKSDLSQSKFLEWINRIINFKKEGQ